MDEREEIRILVVEDQAIVREGLCAMLELKPGLTVVGVAANGEEAVAEALWLQPDLILMDLVMPKKGGVAATREIMAVWNSNPEIPDMRTAAYVSAINKVATSYAELGIFP